MTKATHRAVVRVVPVALVLVLTALQLVRLLVFVSEYGGVEHDGGWMLGVSRSLAEQGTYSTMFNTIDEPFVRGVVDHEGIFNYQAADGRMWFVSSGVGFASIVPDAAILKVFGFGFWALRAGPILFYVLLLVVTAFVVYRLGGVGSILLFYGFVFFFPHVSIFLGYEAMGEVPSAFYVMCAVTLFAGALGRNHRRFPWFLGVGVVAGLAVNTKLLALLAVIGVYLWAGFCWASGRQYGRSLLRVGWKEMLGLGLGLIAVEIGWLLIETVALIRFAGVSLFRQHVASFADSFLDNGSGVGVQLYSGVDFLLRKFFVLQEVSNPYQWAAVLTFALVVFGGVSLLWLWRGKPGSQRQTLLACLWLGFVVTTVWYVFEAQLLYVRHYYLGLYLFVVLASVVPVALMRQAVRSKHAEGGGSTALTLHSAVSLGAGGGLLLLILWSFSLQPYVGSLLLKDDIVAHWRDKVASREYDASIPWMLVPRAAQQEAVDFLLQLPQEAHVFYPAVYKTAEIPPQTGRVHFPLVRRGYPDLPANSQDVLIISPDLLAAWSLDPVMKRELRALIDRSCPNPLLQNDYYMICRVDELVSTF